MQRHPGFRMPTLRDVVQQGLACRCDVDLIVVIEGPDGRERAGRGLIRYPRALQPGHHVQQLVQRQDVQMHLAVISKLTIIRLIVLLQLAAQQ